MLIKRTNILFDQEMWKTLALLSKTEKVSVGKLVRQAVADKYLWNNKYLSRKKAIEEIMVIRKQFKGKINYRSLIEDGRKY